MPYQSIDELPDAVRSAYSERCQRVFMEAFNGHDGDEDSAFRIAHTAAKNCQAATSKAVKFVGPDTIEGLAIPYGSPGSRDLDGEYFTERTDLALDWFGKSGRPVLYDHGMDDSHGATPIGTQIEYESREEGLWARAQLDRAARYRKTVDRMIEEGALGYSSGAMGHLATKSADGEITRWPWVELSLTPIPAHPMTQVHYVKSSGLLDYLTDVAALKRDAADPDSDDALPDGAKVPDQLDRLIVDADPWVRARRDWHRKSGRVLSAATRERIASHPAALRQLADDLDELLASADTRREAKAAFDRDLELIRASLMGVPVA